MRSKIGSNWYVLSLFGTMRLVVLNKREMV